MNDLISRQEAVDVLNRGLSKIPYVNNTDEEMIRRDERMSCIQEIRELPSVQPRKGKWILDNPHSEIYRYACSECHAHHRARYDFCPSCGADMRSEAREYLEYGKLIAKGIAQGLRGDYDEVN